MRFGNTIINRVRSQIMQRKSVVIASLLLLSVSLSTPLSAQKAMEIGANTGVSYYMGDINPGKHFYASHINLGGFVKLHFNSRSLIKLGCIYTNLSGKDSDFNNQFQILRDHSFKTSLIELAAMYEVHFLPYSISDTKKLSFTPYLQLGLAAYWAKSAEDNFNWAIPIGFGMKKNILPRIVFAVEWSFRKTFSDLLDSLSGEDLNDYDQNYGTVITSSNNSKQSGFKYNKDWYSMVCVTISYTFRVGGLKCNAYY